MLGHQISCSSENVKEGFSQSTNLSLFSISVFGTYRLYSIHYKISTQKTGRVTCLYVDHLDGKDEMG